MSVPEPAAVDTALLPSEYTALLLFVLRQRPGWVAGARVLEIGCGSGVLLAAAGALGARALAGVDIEAAAVEATARLLASLDLPARVELHQGDLFAPVAGQRFDLITANLPHFPMAPAPIGQRRASWSAGGADGRALLDRFVAALGPHLAPRGRAVVAHNAFVDLAATRAAARRQGLALEVAATTLVAVPPAKLARMTPAVLRRESGRTLHRYGGHVFGELHVVAIGRDLAADDGR